MWSLLVILKIHIPLHHPAHPACSGPRKMPNQTRRTLSKPDESVPVTSPAKRGSPELDNHERVLRRRKPTTPLPSSARSPRLEPSLPSSLKEAVVVKCIEWLEANKTGGAGIVDSVEELEELERQAPNLNAHAFRLWERRMYW